MSIAELTRKTRLSERSVQNAVRDLVTLRELEVRAEGGGRGRRSGWHVPVKGADSAPFEDGNPAESAPFTGTPQNLHPLRPPGNPAESAPFTNGHRRSGQVDPVKGAESAPLQIPDMFITTTGRSTVQVKDVSEVGRSDVERLCRHLADRIEANGSKRPTVSKRWRDAARLMLDNDGRTEQQVITAIDWCQDSEFWRANIMSMPKLREKYEQMRLQASRKPGGSGRQAQVDALFGDAMARAQAKEGRR